MCIYVHAYINTSLNFIIILLIVTIIILFLSIMLQIVLTTIAMARFQENPGLDLATEEGCKALFEELSSYPFLKNK